MHRLTGRVARGIVPPRLVLFTVVLAPLAVLGAAWTSPASAATPACVITDGSSAKAFGTLQEAVDAATAGDKLKVKGTCYGDATVSKDLTIVGQSSPSFGPATLNGNNTKEQPGSVIVDHGSTLLFSGLVISGGYNNEPARREPGGPITNTAAEKGGGIYNEDGSLKLSNCTIAGNTATYSGHGTQGETYGGGGIYNELGSLTLANTTVSGNSGLGSGGGIYNVGGIVRLINGTVGENRATYSDRGIEGDGTGGGIFSSGGSVSLTKSSVLDNHAEGLDGVGGIEARGGTLRLNSSSVSENSGGAGGGLFNGHASVTLRNSVVTLNVAVEFGDGGGILNDGTLKLTNTNVTNNSAKRGGGIYNEAALTLAGSSSVTDNTASVQGGGIYNYETLGGTIRYARGWAGSISGNELDDIFTE